MENLYYVAVIFCALILERIVYVMDWGTDWSQAYMDHSGVLMVCAADV